MLSPKKPKRLPADNPLLRAAFAQQWDMHPSFVVGRRLSPGVLPDYAAWLRAKGIDPESGRMTRDGFAFFAELVAQQNAHNALKRARRLGR